MAPAVAAAAAPAAAAGGGSFIRAALAELLGNVGGEVLTRASSGIGRLGEAPPAVAQGGKYLVGPSELANLERVYGKENLNRAILRLATLGIVDLPQIDVRERIEEDVNRQRAMAQELGERERAMAEINASAQIIPALAQMAGTQAVATGGAAQEFLRNYLARPDFQGSLSTIGTGK
jgi:hypothetical protein